MKLDAVVRYLHDAQLAFRVASFPKPEPLPDVAFPLQPAACMVEAEVVDAGGRPAIACVRSGERVNYAALATAIGAEVTPGSAGDLAEATAPVPPLGGLLGVPLFVDERVATALMIAFPAFGDTDIVELEYDDFARLERPRVAAFADYGELPEHATS